MSWEGGIQTAGKYLASIQMIDCLRYRRHHQRACVSLAQSLGGEETLSMHSTYLSLLSNALGARSRYRVSSPVAWPD